MKSIKNILALVSIVILASSCSKDDPIPVNEEELITTVIVNLTPQTGSVVTLKSVDLDGDGPNPPVITVSGDLVANTTYTGSTKVLNETESPAEDITLEVKEEGNEHQFFYTFSNSLASTTYTDTDENGNPIGVDFTLTTAAAGTGNLTVTLKHEPIKTASGVKGGSVTNAGGETDVEAIFALNVK